jgi:hypothetical protein
MSDLDKIGERAPKKVDRIAEEEENANVAGSKRKTRVSNVKNWCVIAIMIVFTGLIIFLIIVRVLQLIVPARYIWLSQEQIKNINEFFVDGSLGGLVVTFFRAQIMDDKK